MTWGKRLIVILFGLIMGCGAISVSKHQQAIVQAERDYEETDVSKLENIGTTGTLSILPLVNWHTKNDQYQGEQGVSYLIKTDYNTILFDVGHNKEKASPSPLQHNMNKAGVSLGDIDTIFISHNHFDHLGGRTWSSEDTFSLGNQQVDLTGKKVYTPIPMIYPGIDPIYTPDPTVIAKGVATSGTITRKLVIGPVDEQVLAINLKGKGIVLIVGCGHQTTTKTLERAQKLFDEPIYGVIGDLHYPFPDGRINVAGINAQRIFASGSGIFRPLTQATINDEILLLVQQDLGIVALGGHDSSDAVIDQFSKVFKDKYRSVRVGEWIHVNEQNHLSKN